MFMKSCQFIRCLTIEAVFFNTVVFGLIPMEPFLKVASFTTLTEKKPTIDLKILSFATGQVT